MLVYREAAERFTKSELLEALGSAFRRLAEEPLSDDAAVGALIHAGEVESALADLRSAGARAAAALTDLAAACLLPPSNRSTDRIAGDAAGLIARLDLPPHICLRPLVGFAYYALHPQQYAALAQKFLQTTPECRSAAVVGIRSIGAPLSAVVVAALRSHGIAAERITVRPWGHPFDRELRTNRDEQAWMEAHGAAGAHFLIVDEGPGRSGSSFLSTAEAAVRCGIEPRRIALFCSHEPRTDNLIAPDAANRWHEFRCSFPACDSSPLPQRRGHELSAGAWRSVFYADSSQWPGVWPATERVKFLADDEKSVFKFEGLGRYGDRVLQRSAQLAEGGWGPGCGRAAAGFVRYARIHGRPANGELSRNTLIRIAEYCAWRSRKFAASAADHAELERMANYNLHTLGGWSAPAGELRLACVRPVLADGHMMPWEWVRTSSGLLIKSDGAAHGDDHFYPGAVDIAWDLAGAIVEWNMPRGAARELLDRYGSASGDDAEPRMPTYVAAYLSFRIAFLTMASESCDHAERARLQRSLEHYRVTLAQVMAHPLAQSA